MTIAFMPEVAKFHNLAHIFISLTGAILLLAIWYNIRKRFRQILEEDDSQKRVDKGLLHLSMAMFVWVLSGGWAYIGHAFMWTGSISYQLGINLFSTLNNLFLLLALFYFYHAPAFIYHNQKNIKKIIFVIIGVSALTLMLPQFLGENNLVQNMRISSMPDLVLSGFLSFLLVLSFYRTFVQRGLKVVAYISVLVIVLMFISQLPEVFLQLDNGFTNNLLKIIAKTSLISIFLVLATSWVIRLASAPRPNEMSIKFLDWSLVKLTIPSKGVYDKVIDFGAKTTQYKNLFKFAVRRKYGAGESQSIGVHAGGEIKNQSYLSRILENLNDILELEDVQKLDRRDLFTFLGQGQYRLRVVPENIRIDSTLLEEFVKTADNQEYSTLCNQL
ncbi:MAG: hypothetical protein AAF990_15535 [Bacteroidota bacterium]